MFRRDWIFWVATGVFALSLALATIHYLFLFLMIGAYLLRPTLHSLGIARDLVDERQMSIQHRSGNLGFVVMLLTAIVIAVVIELQGGHADYIYMIICLGLAAKALANVVLTGDHRVTGVRIAVTVGLLYLLFGFLEGDFSLGLLIHSIPGLIILSLGLLGKKFPRIAALLLAGAAVYSVFFFNLLRRSNPGSFSVLLLIPLPLLIAAACLISRERSGNQTSDAGAASAV